MDRAVLEAYGWDDLAAAARCEFLLDYEEEDDDVAWGRAAGRSPKRKSPGVSAGPTNSATKSSPASSNSTNNAPKKSSC